MEHYVKYKRADALGGIQVRAVAVDERWEMLLAKVSIRSAKEAILRIR